MKRIARSAECISTGRQPITRLPYSGKLPGGLISFTSTARATRTWKQLSMHIVVLERRLEKANQLLEQREKVLQRVNETLLVIADARLRLDLAESKLTEDRLGIAGLTRTQLQIYRMIKTEPSLRRKEIAARLNCSESAVAKQVGQILAKLGVGRCAEL